MLRMPFLVDGHNLLFRLGGGADRKLRETLARTLEEGARRLGRNITVVFDGLGEEESRLRKGLLEIRYSAAGEDADAVIARLVEETPHHYVLVTADRALARRLRRLVQRVEAPAEFARRLGAEKDEEGGEEKPTEPDAHEVRYWLRLFGEEQVG